MKHNRSAISNADLSVYSSRTGESTSTGCAASLTGKTAQMVVATFSATHRVSCIIRCRASVDLDLLSEWLAENHLECNPLDISFEDLSSYMEDQGLDWSEGDHERGDDSEFYNFSAEPDHAAETSVRPIRFPRFFPNGPDNNDRASFAATALQAYFSETRFNAATYGDEGSSEMDEAFGDLLCDLRHLAERAGLDWAVLNNRGELTYLEEQAEEAAVPD